MIHGNIENGRDPKIEIPMRVGNESIPLTVLVDSGFSGELALHFDRFDQFQLEFIRPIRVQYGDGSIVDELLCLGQIEWNGVVRTVQIVLSGDEEPAIGMGLLWGTRVLLDCVDDTVTVAFPPESIADDERNQNVCDSS